MTTLKSEFLHTIKERGFLHQCTDLEGLDALLCGKPITAYIGFDCTAPSLHVGSLMQIMILRWFQKCGHRPIVLMGGGTTKIGDPSGKDEARKLLDDAQINANMAGIKKNFTAFIKFAEEKEHTLANYPNSSAALMLDNDVWLSTLSMGFVMRELGPLISVNTMLTKDSIRNRLERHQHLSYLEFNYMILQAYDFIKLYQDHHCQLQIGGSDQWGNITAGIELHQKMHYKNATKQPIFGLTTPLITTSSGAKMGKTASGAVWLNADMLSPFDYWQFWRNTEDGDVGRFLRFFTELPISEIEKLEKLQGAEINEAKKILANEATKLCHGEEAAKAAAETARKTFEEGSAGDNLKTVPMDNLDVGIPAFKVLYDAGLASSSTAARRLIEGGGARINDVKLTDYNVLVSAKDIKEGHIKISAGKKQHVLIKPKTN